VHESRVETLIPMPAGRSRRLPIGAEVRPGGVDFRVWAPARERVVVVIDGGDVHPLTPESDGYHAGFAPGAKPGDRYLLSLDDDPTLLADPMSRFQPEGPFGPSMVIDPLMFPWTDGDWTGPDLTALVVYEMHIGTFTRAGTWKAAIDGLPAVADLGVTCLEVMPVADFAGRFGWGYDGVNLFAPTRLYGTPDDFRAFVNAAHALGLAVILDVVYNHLGPAGCSLGQFAPAYFGGTTEWGQAINFDGADAAPVREFFVTNARYWIDEFHLDGLRLDAVQAIHDTSDVHIVHDITSAVRQTAGLRTTWIVGEDEPQDTRLLRGSGRPGLGLDALWNDDFHHSAMVAATGRREAYFTDYLGSPQEFISAAKYGFLYQGQWYAWQQQGRGTPALGVQPDAFVCCLQNHDQVANGPGGARLHELTSLSRVRALTALLLLGPWIPMLFQGQEYAADAPFLYFADHTLPLADAVRDGRETFLSQFPSTSDAVATGAVPDPRDVNAFDRSVLPADGPRGGAMRALHASLLRLRQSERAFRAQHRHGLDGAVLGPNAFLLRFFADTDTPHGDDRLVLINLGQQLELAVLPEPLLAPPSGTKWTVIWSSDDALYGGPGVSPVIRPTGWSLSPDTACVLAPIDLRGPA
jgi:maltooligosyltrehalose trehalohydrolase